MFVDSHAHLDDEKLRGREDEIVKAAADNGVNVIINAGCDLATSIASVELSERFSGIYATVGVHPHEADGYNPEVEKELMALATKNKAVAWGEIGLDYHYDFSPRENQKEVLARQLAVADEVKKPIVFHVREAYEDFNNILKNAKTKINSGILLHCYSGSAELAEYYSKEYDAYFSFGGSMTFAKHKAEVLARIPKERLLLETDCPYMTPVPYRGTSNEPKYIPINAAKMAELTNLSVEEIEKITTENALRFYGIKQ